MDAILEQTIPDFVGEKNAQAAAQSPQQPLRYYVERTMQHYFAQLDGTEPDNLYELVLAEVEAPLLEVVLKIVKNNQTKAAQMLGLNRGTLRKKLKQYNLD
jgi:Fis family transcriptional regulator, factor for inversion stimulation protein